MVIVCGNEESVGQVKNHFWFPWKPITNYNVVKVSYFCEILFFVISFFAGMAVKVLHSNTFFAPDLNFFHTTRTVF